MIDPEKVKIEKVSCIEDIEQCFDCISTAFGAEKPMLNAMYPNHQTREGRERGIKRLTENWQKYKDNDDFHFLKAVMFDDEKVQNRIVGFAVWTAMTFDKNLESDDAAKEYDLDYMYPNQPKHQDWLKQVWKQYISPRRRVVLNGKNDNSNVFVCFELCAIRPEMQRKGVGKQLTEWGLNYARKIKAQEAIVEASVPGVGCYRKAGFVHQEPIDFSKVNPKLLEIRPFPNIMFMRTGPLK